MYCGVGGCKRYEHPLLHADDSTQKIPYSDWNDVTHGKLVWEKEDGDIPECLTMSVVMRLAEEGEIGVQRIPAYRQQSANSPTQAVKTEYEHV